MEEKAYQLPKLGYRYDALEPGYSAELLELHHTRHHQAYVDGANQTLMDLAEARERREFRHLNQLQKSLAFNVSGHILHSIFWRNLAPGDAAQPDTFLSGFIQRAFGDLDALEAQFRAAGAAIQGSGWAALCWDSICETLVVEQMHDHEGNAIRGAVPLLVMDMWEHAFYLQYRHDKQRWIGAFWDLINWRDVSNRLKRSIKLDLGLVNSEAFASTPRTYGQENGSSKPLSKTVVSGA